MKRTWMPLLAGLVLVASLLPFTGCGDGDGLVVITPATHDFGRVLQGELPTTTFTVTNNTDRVVSLMPQASCSCFAVEGGKSLRPLDPGEAMNVRVIFDSTAKPPGPVQGKYVTFNLDHPRQKSVIVPLKGEIYQAYAIYPPMLNLGRIDGRPRNYEARTVKVSPRSGYTIRLERVAATPDVFDIKTTKAESGALEVSLTLRRGIPPRRLGAFRSSVRLELELTSPGGTTFSQRPVVNVSGSWAIKPDGTAIPR